MINRGVLKLRALLSAQPDLRAPSGCGPRCAETWPELFDRIDVLAWPTVPAVAPSLTDPMIELPSGTTSADAGNARQGVIANLTGVPGVSVPVGLDDGMPVALQLLGAWGSDALLLDAAEALERATDREFVELQARRDRLTLGLCDRASGVGEDRRLSSPAVAAIETQQLAREFEGGIKAVDGVDLEVAEGEIYGFLGPERRRQDHHRPDADHAAAADRRARRRRRTRRRQGSGGAVRRKIGVALQEAALDPLMTGRELLELQATLHGIPRKEGQRAGAVAARPRRAHPRGRPPGRHLLGRHAPPPRPGRGPGPHPGGPLPRRADHRPRPGQPQGDLGGGPQAERRGDHRLPHHPVPGGGRPARRSRRDHHRRHAWSPRAPRAR